MKAKQGTLHKKSGIDYGSGFNIIYLTFDMALRNTALIIIVFLHIIPFEILGWSQNLWRSFQFHTRDMASWQAPFSLVNLTWILGAFFGAIVGLGRAYLPEEAGLQVDLFLEKR